MSGEEYIQWGAEARRRVAELCAAVAEGRISEAEGVAAVEELHREARGVYAVAAAECVVVEAQSRGLDGKARELEERLARLRGEPGPA